MKTILITLLAAGAVAAGGFYFFVVQPNSLKNTYNSPSDLPYMQQENNTVSNAQKSNPQAKTPTSPIQQPSSSKTETSDESLAELILAGGTKKCVYTGEKKTTGGTLISKLILYMADSRARIDGTDKEENVEFSMLFKDNTLYVWSAGAKRGTKLPYSTEEQAAFIDVYTQNILHPPGGEVTVTHTCNLWTVDPGKFTLPSSIQF
jgi:hypothetical protein